MNVLGNFPAEVHYKKQAPSIIVAGDGPCLLALQNLGRASLVTASFA